MTKKSLVSAVILVFFFGLFSSPVKAMIRIGLDGSFSQIAPAVLGEDDAQGEENKEDSKEENKVEEVKSSDSVQTEESKKQQEQNKEAEKKEIERVRELLKKNAEQAKKIQETNREIIKKIEEKAREERQRNIEQIKVRSQNSLKVSVASESGEIEDVEDEEIEMETEHGNVGFKTSSKDNSVEISQGNFSALTSLPISIEPKTKEVFVESDGEKHEVKVLPEEAMLSASPSGTLEKLEIVVENGQVVYLINDIKKEKLLGLFSISIPKETKVSGETGSVLETRQNILNMVLDFLSI